MATLTKPDFSTFKSPQEAFLRKGPHTTIHFSRFSAENPGIYVETKYTMDPNEEMDCETLTIEEATAKYDEALKDGFKPADGWHKDKRCESWYDDGHDD